MTALALLTTTAGCAVVRDRQTVGAYVDHATLTARVVTLAANEAHAAQSSPGMALLPRRRGPGRAIPSR